MKQQSGFTLIELITVIVILGILAATALPKFGNFAADARMSKMNGLAGALKTAAALTHGQSLIESTSPASTVTFEGDTISMSAYYPTASGMYGIVSAIDSTGYVISYPITGQLVEFYPDQAHANVATCGVSYVTAVLNAAGIAVAAAPVVDVTAVSTVVGCD